MGGKKRREVTGSLVKHYALSKGPVGVNGRLEGVVSVTLTERCG